MNSKLEAGFARRIISPPKGIYLIGYGDRLWGNRGIHDDLTASALALDNGETRVVIIACDLLAMNEITLKKVEVGVNTKLLLCCSHTHSGPIVYADERSNRKNNNYVEFLVNQLIEVTREALVNLEPVGLFWSTSRADIAVNRRERKPDGKVVIGINPEGVIDNSVGIIQLQTEQRFPLVNMVNLACHNVVLGPKNLLGSSDWAGVMRRNVENQTGVPCLFIQGAAGDLNPNHEWSDNDFDAAERMGAHVAERVISGLENLQPIESVPLNYIKTDLWLPLETKAEGMRPPLAYRSILADLVGIPGFLVDTILNKRYPWKTIIDNKDGYWSIPLAVSVLQIGEIFWVGLGAEVFTEIGMQIKSLSPTGYAFFSSLTNGCIGYLPTREEYSLGGYEIDLAPYFYRLPGRLQNNAADLAIDTAKSLLSQIASQG